MTSQSSDFPLLMQINSPADLRRLQEDQLADLAKEIRDYMVYSLNQCGGHFGASMGTVELTIALHRVFNTPDDRIVWDVGHQAYIHKILTGRRDRLNTIKQPGGLAPFPKRGESEYDCFGVGHSSTSISAALGMAIGSQDAHPDRRCIAVIGDGGLTGGMAFEALNHGGAIDPNMIVILNDNDMSISENVGALTHYFARILSGKVYSSLRERSKKLLAKLPHFSKFAKLTETHIKGMIVPGTIFEELGFHYIGPIDGHDLPKLIQTLSTLRPLTGAKLLHVITKKGKGYYAAEQSPIQFHAVSPGFHTKKADSAPQKKSAPLTYSKVFGQWLCAMAEKDQRLMGITPAMREGSGMVDFAQQFPKRFHDVSIAEQHSVTFAAGLACEGKKPIVAIYSSFLQRAYDQLIHDVALQNLDVTFAIDRAGLVGSDGPTHAGSFDLSFLRCIPNMVIMAPADEQECWQMLTTAYHYHGPAAVRYPRGAGPGSAIKKDFTTLPLAKGTILRKGRRIAILAFGSLVTPALNAGQKLDATVANMRFIKPLDAALIEALAREHELLVTVEENATMGGAGTAISEQLAVSGLTVPILHLGLPDYYIDHGKHGDMLAACGLDACGIEQSIRSRLTKLEKDLCDLSITS